MYAPTLQPITTHTAFSDTGASRIYIAPHDSGILRDVHPDPAPISVQQADGTIIRSTHLGTLDLPQLPDSVRNAARVLPDLRHSLLGTPAFADAGLTTTYLPYHGGVRVTDTTGATL